MGQPRRLSLKEELLNFVLIIGIAGLMGSMIMTGIMFLTRL